MSFLSELLKESASGGATTSNMGANTRNSLFGVNGNNEKGDVNVMIRRMGFVSVEDLLNKKTKKKKKLFSTISEADNSAAAVKPFDYQETLAKLDQAVKTAGERKENVAVFGLEDDEGKIVKVYIDKDQADNFEEALGDTVFADEDEPKTETEIAEILYKLKDQFEIRDVVWGNIQGDEEEEFEVEGEGDLGDEEGMEGEMGDEEGMEGEMDDEEGMEGEMGADATEANATTALQSVIDMMRADSDARKAEALARQSEAEAVIAKNAALAAQAQVEKEEDLLDMQTAEKAEKAAKKEAEQLAKLARYKKEVGDADAVLAPEDDEADFAAGMEGGDEMPADDMDMGGEDDFGMEGEENEEKVVMARETPQREISKEQLAKLILKYAKSHGQ